MQPTKRQASLRAKKNTAVDRGCDRTLGSDPQAGGVLDFSSTQPKRLAIVNGVADVIFIAEDRVDHSSCPGSSKMIGNAFTIEPSHDLFFGFSVLDVRMEYLLDHLDLV